MWHATLFCDERAAEVARCKRVPGQDCPGTLLFYPAPGPRHLGESYASARAGGSECSKTGTEIVREPLSFFRLWDLNSGTSAVRAASDKLSHGHRPAKTNTGFSRKTLPDAPSIVRSDSMRGPPAATGCVGQSGVVDQPAGSGLDSGARFPGTAVLTEPLTSCRRAPCRRARRAAKMRPPESTSDR